MARPGYDFASSSMLGKKNLGIIRERRRDLTETQKKLKERGYGVELTKVGLDFIPVAPIKILGK